MLHLADHFDILVCLTRLLVIKMKFITESGRQYFDFFSFVGDPDQLSIVPMAHMF